MLTREQIEEIQGEAREKGTAIKALLKEKGIPEHQYFWWWKREYAREIVPEGFLPVANGSLPVVIGAVLHRVRTLPGDDREDSSGMPEPAHARRKFFEVKA